MSELLQILKNEGWSDQLLESIQKIKHEIPEKVSISEIGLQSNIFSRIDSSNLIVDTNRNYDSNSIIMK
jgi:hypothetical protein